jgi:cytochrome c-type biogenesis protein CcmE
VPRSTLSGAARTTRSPARLIVALAVAAVLAIFLVYTALAGNSTPTLRPSQLAAEHPSKVAVEGTVVGPVRGDSHSAAGLRFRVRDIGSKGAAIPVVYHGDSPPPLFAVGRSVVVNGNYANGRIDGTGIVTKCPSKYVPAKSA